MQYIIAVVEGRKESPIFVCRFSGFPDILRLNITEIRHCRAVNFTVNIAI